MKVHYSKLYNMAHFLLSLNLFTASKGSNNYILAVLFFCTLIDKKSFLQPAPELLVLTSSWRFNTRCIILIDQLTLHIV